MDEAQLRSAPVVTDGKVGCSTLLWHYRGRPQLTVIVKASFGITHGGVASFVGPASILDEDVTLGRNPARSVEAASDLAPYKPRCDVTLIGHAHAPAGSQVTALSVRLGLAREGRPILDKVVGVVGDRGPDAKPLPFARMRLSYERARGGPGEENPVGTSAPNLVHPTDATRGVGVGPISPFWPTRKGLVGADDQRALAEPIPRFPDAMPWAYYQVAPLDQQIDPLWGGEQLVLDGVHPSLPRVETWIPVVRGAARVVDRGAGGAERSVDMVCDALAIDADAQRFTLVWRGRVEGFEDASRLIVAAGLAAPGSPVDWNKVLSAPMRPSPALAAPKAAPPVDSTVGLTDSELATPPRSLPFGAGKRADGRVGEGTVGMVDADHHATKQRPIAPFEVAVPKPDPLGELAPGLPWSPSAEAPPPPRRAVDVPPRVAGSSAARAAVPAGPLAEQLRATGASSEEIAELLAALTLPERSR